MSSGDNTHTHLKKLEELVELQRPAPVFVEHPEAAERTLRWRWRTVGPGSGNPKCTIFELRLSVIRETRPCLLCRGEST